jgi:hypothetical protein
MIESKSISLGNRPLPQPLPRRGRGLMQKNQVISTPLPGGEGLIYQVINNMEHGLSW